MSHRSAAVARRQALPTREDLLPALCSAIRKGNFHRQQRRSWIGEHHRRPGFSFDEASRLGSGRGAVVIHLHESPCPSPYELAAVPFVQSNETRFLTLGSRPKVASPSALPAPATGTQWLVGPMRYIDERRSKPGSHPGANRVRRCHSCKRMTTCASPAAYYCNSMCFAELTRPTARLRPVCTNCRVWRPAEHRGLAGRSGCGAPAYD